MRIIILLSFLALIAEKTGAQNIVQDTVQWTATKAVKQSDQSAIVYTSSFASNGSASVDWAQKAMTVHYTVDQIQGTWTSLAQDGSIAYQISTPWGVTGTITFARSNGQYTIHLQTQVEGGDGLDLVFQVSNIQPQ